MIKVIIDRAKWDRGISRIGKRALLNEQGGKCCLGFVCNALGFSDEEIQNIFTPRLLFKKTKNSKLNSLIDEDNFHNPNTHHAMSANDSESLSEKDREYLIASNLAKIGFDVEFVGEGKWKP